MKLKWKIFGFLLGFCGLLLLILWMFETVFLYDMYKLIRKSEMRSAVEAVEKNIDSPELSEIIGELKREHEILVTEPGVLQWKSTKNKPGGREETLIRAEEFVKADGTNIQLTFYARVTPVDATVSTLRFQLIFITAIMILLSVLLALLIARHVARPLEEVNKSAKALAKGDYEADFRGKGFLEIEELSDTLNTAALELSKVEGLRRELLGNIAHDLRTPLSLIYSYAEMMHDFPDEITRDQTRTIMEEASRLSSLVHDVFEISKLETGNQTLNLSCFNLTKEVESSVGRLEELTKKDGYHLTFQAEGDAFVCADSVKIAQVVYNLLLNAIHYAGEDKEVEVSESLGDGYVKIAVTDHGEGISGEDLPYIWERYYKVDKSHKRAVTGTGLGLSIVKKIVGMHGGTFGVTSVVGKGSTFWFQLPVQKKE